MLMGSHLLFDHEGHTIYIMFAFLLGSVTITLIKHPVWGLGNSILKHTHRPAHWHMQDL